MRSRLMSICLIGMVAVFGLVLAACGSGSADVASLGEAEDTETADADADGAVDDEAAVLAFTQCMREQGIEFEDPVVDSDGNVRPPQPVEGAEVKREDVKALYEACSEHLEGVTFGKERGKELDVDQFVELAACLRDEGFDVDDPTAETLKLWLADFRVEFDFDDPDAQAAYEACGGEGWANKGPSSGEKE